MHHGLQPSPVPPRLRQQGGHLSRRQSFSVEILPSCTVLHGQAEVSSTPWPQSNASNKKYCTKTAAPVSEYLAEPRSPASSPCSTNCSEKLPAVAARYYELLGHAWWTRRSGRNRGRSTAVAKEPRPICASSSRPWRITARIKKKSYRPATTPRACRRIPNARDVAPRTGRAPSLAQESSAADECCCSFEVILTSRRRHSSSISAPHGSERGGAPYSRRSLSSFLASFGRTSAAAGLAHSSSVARPRAACARCRGITERTPSRTSSRVGVAPRAARARHRAQGRIHIPRRPRGRHPEV